MLTQDHGWEHGGRAGAGAELAGRRGPQRASRHAPGNWLAACAREREGAPSEKILTGTSFVLASQTKESTDFVSRAVLDLGDFGKNPSTKN